VQACKGDSVSGAVGGGGGVGGGASKAAPSSAPAFQVCHITRASIVRTVENTFYRELILCHMTRASNLLAPCGVVEWRI
jgi:hypothetical protein